MKKSIKGKVVYNAIGTGFWGIVDENGKQWRPVNMPEKLKQNGKTVEVTIREAREDFSIFMWGSPIRIMRF